MYFPETALHLLNQSACDYLPTETVNQKTQMFVVFIGGKVLKYHICKPFGLSSIKVPAWSTQSFKSPAALFQIKISTMQRNMCMYMCQGDTWWPIQSCFLQVWGLCGIGGQKIFKSILPFIFITYK